MKQGAALRRLIIASGLTIEEFSKMAGYDAYESMSRKFRLEYLKPKDLERFAKLLNISPDDIINYGKQDASPPETLQSLIAQREVLINQLTEIHARIQNFKP